MPRILHIDGYGLSGSVSLSQDAKACGHLESGGQELMTFLAPAIRRLMDEAGWTPARLDGISVNTGPGSYTSLRSSISLARGMALAAGIPLIGLPRPGLMARACEAGQKNVLVAFHARAGTWNRYVYNADLELVESGQLEFQTLEKALKELSHGTAVLEPHPDFPLPEETSEGGIKYLKTSSLHHIAWSNHLVVNGLIDQYANADPVYFSEPHITVPKK